MFKHLVTTERIHPLQEHRAHTVKHMYRPWPLLKATSTAAPAHNLLDF